MKNIVDDIRLSSSVSRERESKRKIIRIHLCVKQKQRQSSLSSSSSSRSNNNMVKGKKEIVMADLETLNFITHFFSLSLLTRCVEPSLWENDINLRTYDENRFFIKHKNSPAALSLSFSFLSENLKFHCENCSLFFDNNNTLI